MPSSFGSTETNSRWRFVAEDVSSPLESGSVPTPCACGFCRLGVLEDEPHRAGDGTAGLPGNKPVYTLDQAMGALLRANLGWTPGATVAYSFRESLPPGADSKVKFQAFSAIERELSRYAFDLFADVVNLRFAEAPDNGVATGQGGRIYLGADMALPSYEWGHASNWSFNTSPVRTLASSEIWISTTAVATRQWFVGGYNFQALMHEIGHSLGLSHPGAYNAEADKTITYAANAEYAQDSRQFTIMSYFSAAETGSDFFADIKAGIYSPSTPMLHDVAALQKRYGANMSTRAGDTVYGYNSTAGRASYDFNLNPTPIFTIWDGGGIDTLDFTQTTYAVNLNLNAGAFSDAFQMTNNISIAFGVVVENAKGGSAADYMMGNAAANRLEGLGGDDSLWGADGDDKLFGGDGSDVLVGQAGDDELWGGAGRDLLYGWSGTDILVGEAGDDELWGGEGRDFLYGWSGADTLIGQDGDDELWGGEDNDVLWGWAGRDLLIGQEGDDQLWGGEDNDSLWGWSGNDILVGGTGNDDLWGGEGRDFLYGWQDDDTLVGGDGDDELWGGEGRDFLYGWQGSDVLIGNDGDDELWGGEGRDFLYGWTGSDVLIGNDGDDELWGGEDGDFLYGWTGGDYLIGGEGNDELWGGEDNDRLFGGSGADKLVGGTGADVFVFHGLADSAPTASDRIWDFSSAEGDIVDLALIDANSSLAGDQAFSLVSAFSGQAGQATLTFNAAGNTSTLNLDVNGDGQADFTLLFTGQVGTTGWLW